jgi:hypothetical protein
MVSKKVQNVTYSHRRRALTPLIEFSVDACNVVVKFVIDSHLLEKGGPYFGQLLSQASISHGILINRDSIQERPHLHCRYSSRNEIPWNVRIRVEARNLFRALCTYIIDDTELLHVTSCFIQAQGTSNSICVQWIIVHTPTGTVLWVVGPFQLY